MFGGAEARRGLEKAVLSEVRGLTVRGGGGLWGRHPAGGLARTGLGVRREGGPGTACRGTLIGVKVVMLVGRWEGLVGREKAVQGFTGGSKGEVGMLFCPGSGRELMLPRSG